MKTSIRHRVGDVVQQVGQVPDIAREAARLAINATLRTGRQAVYAAMRRVFDRPTPYTLNALRLEDAPLSGALAGAVMVKGKQDVMGAGVPAQSVLRAEILGGGRRWKRFELALMRAGILPRGWFAVPGKGARLDAWGNMSRGQVVQIMAYLQLFAVAKGARAAGYRSNSSAKSLARIKQGTRNRFGLELFVSSPLQATRRSGLAYGIWQKQNNRKGSRIHGAPAPVRALVIFVQRARYVPRLDFFGELQRHSAAQLPAAIDRAARTARRARPLKDAP